MALTKRIYAYPERIRTMFYYLASNEGPVEKTIQFRNHKNAVRERAKLYHLRKLLAEAAAEQGNQELAEKFYTIGISLDFASDGSGGARLTLYNQHCGFSDETMTAAEELIKDAGPNVYRAPQVHTAELEEFQNRLLQDIQGDTPANPYYTED